MTRHFAFLIPLVLGLAALGAQAAQSTTSEGTPPKAEHSAAPSTPPQPPADGWKEGTHYTTLPAAQPTQAGRGQVEVLEFFWFACPHCYALEPDVQKWLQSKPRYVKFTRVHVVWNPRVNAHARLYYTLQELGRKDLDDDVFNTIHQEKNPLVVQNNDMETLRLQTEFAQAHGVSAEEFQKAYQSAAVEARMREAEQLGKSYKVTGVPAMAVNGKYVTDVSQAGGQSNLMLLVSHLAAGEKNHR